MSINHSDRFSQTKVSMSLPTWAGSYHIIKVNVENNIKKFHKSLECFMKGHKTNLHMPPDKVSIKWQILFSLISPLDIWAFYRIKKLRRYVLYVLVPSLVIGVSLFGVGYYEMIAIDPLEEHNLEKPVPTLPPYMTPIEPQVGKFDVIPYPLIGIASSVGFSALSVYLVIVWSRQWNEKFTKTGA